MVTLKVQIQMMAKNVNTLVVKGAGKIIMVHFLPKLSIKYPLNNNNYY